MFIMGLISVLGWFCYLAWCYWKLMVLVRSRGFQALNDPAVRSVYGLYLFVHYLFTCVYVYMVYMNMYMYNAFV